MALTYDNSAQLMKDPTFTGRIKVACLKYADYIWAESAAVQGHSSRIRWAQQTFANADASAGQATPATVMDPAVQSLGSTIDDAGLQSAVENVVNRLI
jgi:hypothetical protein